MIIGENQRFGFCCGPQFDEVFDFSEGFGNVKNDGKWGYIDKKGKVVIEPQFDDASDFSEGFAKVKIES